MEEKYGKNKNDVSYRGYNIIKNANESFNVLEAGDSLHFDSSKSHSAWNHTKKVTTLLHVCTMNVFGDKEINKEVPGIFDCRGNLLFSKDHAVDLNIHSSNI